ncbi:hypothetical protein ACHAXS_001214 [Conticribra weissflogii]
MRPPSRVRHGVPLTN